VTTSKAAPAYLMLAALLAAAACGGGSSGGGSGGSSPAGSLVVTGFTPTTGARGDAIAITGTNFSSVSSVMFNGQPATYSVQSSTSIIAIVPSGASTGAITVTTSAGTGTSGTFTVSPTDTNFLPSNLVGLPANGWATTDAGNGDAKIMTVALEGGSKASLTEVGTGGHLIQAWNSQWTSSPVMNQPYTFAVRLIAGARTTGQIQIQSYGLASQSVSFDLSTCTATDANGATHTITSAGPGVCDITVSGQFASGGVSHNGSSWNITLLTSSSGAAVPGKAMYVEDVRLSATNIALSGSSNLTGTLNQATSIVVNSKSCRSGSVNLTASAGFIAFSTLSNACQLIQQRQDPANATLAEVTLARIGTGSSVPLAAGTYTFFDTSPGGIPSFDLTTQTASLVAAGTVTKNGGPASTGNGCTTVEEAQVTGGTVTLTTVTSSAVAGTVDLTLSNGGTISGSFNAPLCTTSADITGTCDLSGLPSPGTGSCL